VLLIHDYRIIYTNNNFSLNWDYAFSILLCVLLLEEFDGGQGSKEENLISILHTMTKSRGIILRTTITKHPLKDLILLFARQEGRRRSQFTAAFVGITRFGTRFLGGIPGCLLMMMMMTRFSILVMVTFKTSQNISNTNT
jgi:hypothetical protein